MPSPINHQGLTQPIARDRPSRELYLAAVLAKMSYVHREPELLRVMRDFLGFDSFAWIQTAGDITVNFLIGKSLDGVVVAFSGTENIWQILYYGLLSFNSITQQDFIGRVHQGFYNIWKGTQQPLLDSLASLPHGAPITLIGHSLGGAVAQLWADKFSQAFQFSVSNLITFGSPAIGDRLITGLLQNVRRTMVRHESDLVPFLPPHTAFGPRFGFSPILLALFFEYVRLQPQLTLFSDGSYQLRDFPLNQWDWQRAGRIIEVLSNPGLGANQVSLKSLFDEHMMSSYLGLLKAILLRENNFGDMDDVEAINGVIDSLELPGQDVTEILPGTLDRLLRSDRPPRPNAQPLPLPQTFVGPEFIQAGNAHTVDGFSQTISTSFEPHIVPFSARPGAPSTAVGGAMDALMFGTPQRPWWRFRGADRVLLEDLQKLMKAIVARDNKVQGTTKGGDGGDGVPFIDRGESELGAAFDTLADHVELLL